MEKRKDIYIFVGVVNAMVQQKIFSLIKALNTYIIFVKVTKCSHLDILGDLFKVSKLHSFFPGLLLIHFTVNTIIIMFVCLIYERK